MVMSVVDDFNQLIMEHRLRLLSWAVFYMGAR